MHRNFTFLQMTVCMHACMHVCKNVRICKNVCKYSVQVKNGNAMVELVVVLSILMNQFLGGREKREWILKLRTVYPYGLNEKVGICEDDKNVRRYCR